MAKYRYVIFNSSAKEVEVGRLRAANSIIAVDLLTHKRPKEGTWETDIPWCHLLNLVTLEETFVFFDGHVRTHQMQKGLAYFG